MERDLLERATAFWVRDVTPSVVCLGAKNAGGPSDAELAQQRLVGAMREIQAKFDGTCGQPQMTADFRSPPAVNIAMNSSQNRLRGAIDGLRDLPRGVRALHRRPG